MRRQWRFGLEARQRGQRRGWLGNNALLLDNAQPPAFRRHRESSAGRRFKHGRNARTQRGLYTDDSSREMGEIANHVSLRNQVEVGVFAQRRERENLALAPA